jgi:hypothetical protein
VLAPVCQAVPRVPLGDGHVPLVHIRAAHAPAEVLGAQPRPLPPGVVAVAPERRPGP